MKLVLTVFFFNAFIKYVIPTGPILAAGTLNVLSVYFEMKRKLYIDKVNYCIVV